MQPTNRNSSWLKPARLAKRRVKATMLDIEEQRLRNSSQINILGLYPKNTERMAARFQITLPLSSKEEVQKTWSGFSMEEKNPDVSQEALLLEDTIIYQEKDTFGIRYLIFSAEVSRSAESIVLAAFCLQTGETFSQGITPRIRDKYLFSFYELTTDAKAAENYHAYYLNQRVTTEELTKQRKTAFKQNPLISIIVPVYNPPISFLREAIESVLSQSYPQWELILVNASPDNKEAMAFLNLLDDSRIKVIPLSENRGITGNTNEGIIHASGDYLAFLDQDDIIEPNTLYTYVQAINNNPDIDLLYCDEDNFTEQNQPYYGPQFKPDNNPDLLLGHNYIEHFLVVRKSLVEQCGLSPDYVSGAQDYDLSFKVLEHARAIKHIPQVLYHWRQHEDSTCGENFAAKPYASMAGRRTIADHLERSNYNAEVVITANPYVYQTTFHLFYPYPKVNIIVVRKTSEGKCASEDEKQLQLCLNAIQEKANYRNYDIHIVDSAGFIETDPEKSEIIENTPLNQVIRQTDGKYILLLDSTTIPQTQGFVSKMLGYFQREEIGIVGSLLYTPDGLIQHAGLALTPEADIMHMNQYHTLDTNKGYLGCTECGYNYTAVAKTGQMFSRELFDKVGGYHPDLSFDYDAFDFCLKARAANKLTVYCPYVSFVCQENQIITSSPSYSAFQKRAKRYFIAHWHDYFKNGDSAINLNCDPRNPYFALRS